MSNRPPVASDVASSSSINRIGIVPPGTPGASLGWSASGQSMVTGTGLEMSGATTAPIASPEVSRGSGGTPTTGNKNRALSSRAGSP